MMRRLVSFGDEVRESVIQNNDFIVLSGYRPPSQFIMAPSAINVPSIWLTFGSI